MNKKGLTRSLLQRQGRKSIEDSEPHVQHSSMVMSRKGHGAARPAGVGLTVSAPALLARRFYMDKTSKGALIGLAVVLALCAAYYFVLRPTINDAKLEECLHPSVRSAWAMTQEARDNCFRQYGNKN